MLILAIDSATPVAGIALMDEEKLIREEFINYKKTHSEILMPMIDRVLKESDCSLEELSAIAITIGPGSFTGLRIGMAAAKGLSLATDKPLVAINTLDALAHNVMRSDALICPLLDARKQEVYSGFYDVSQSFPRPLTETVACSPGEFLACAWKTAEENGRDRFILLGDGYYSYKDYFQEALGENLLDAPQHLMFPRASAVASLGIEKVKQEDFANVFALRPLYIRLSEAEYRLGKGAL